MKKANSKLEAHMFRKPTPQKVNIRVDGKVNMLMLTNTNTSKIVTNTHPLLYCYGESKCY